MSFYNADPRAYFNIYKEVAWEDVWNDEDKSWKNINSYEIGRLIRIKNGDSKSAQNYNGQILVVEYGTDDQIWLDKNPNETLETARKYLKPLSLINPYSITIGEGTSTSADNQTVVGKYNEDNPNALFIVGNGDSSNKHNAFEVLSGEISGIKIGDTTITVKNNTLYVNGAALQTANTTDSTVAYKDNYENESSIELGAFSITPKDGNSVTQKVHFPKNIKDDLTIGTSNKNQQLKINGSLVATKADLTTLKLGQYSIEIMPLSVYERLSEKDTNTLYFITG